MKRYLLALFLSINFSAFAKVKIIKSTIALMHALSAAPYSVAVFYTKDKSGLRNPSLKEKINEMAIMMRSISDDPLYKNGDLQFLLIDISHSSLLAAVHMFKITQFQTTLIFIGREPVGDRLAGFIDRTALTTAINKSLDTLIAARMKQKEYKLKQEVEMAKIRSFDQAYMWGTYWAPYWNWGYAPFWEFGWRPYDRWYYW